jgi:hypothetical protein
MSIAGMGSLRHQHALPWLARHEGLLGIHRCEVPSGAVAAEGQVAAAPSPPAAVPKRTTVDAPPR